MRKSTPIDLRSVRYLVAIVDEGTFARAAEKLNVTQPALSRSVQALEHALRVRLLDRGKSGATPTAFGRLLIERGRSLLSDAAAITRELELLSGAETGAIAVGAGAYPGELCVGPAAGRLLARRPGITIRIAIGDWPELTEKVLTEKLDLAICDLATAEGNPRLRVEPLPQHQGVLFCRTGHPLSKRRAVTLDEAREFPLALTSVPDRLAPVLRREGLLTGSAASPAVHVDTFRLAREIVLRSDAIGGAIAAQIAEDVRARRVVILPLDLPWFTTRYGFIYLAGRTLAPSLQLFMAEVRAVESELAATPDHGREPTVAVRPTPAKPRGRRKTSQRL
ncbi:MAG TPA: LysR family transcriptional regulator [Candidatus Binatia bacterium]|nr:LysR family transcriptional regulator [Candidatus Binatia bacterium]